MNGSPPKVTWLSRESRTPAYNARTAVSEPLGPRSWMQTPLPDGERRALKGLLYLALVAVGFVVLSFVATGAAYFSDILAIFFLAWLLAFLLDPLTALL